MFVTTVEIVTSVTFACGHDGEVLGYGADVESVISDALEVAEEYQCIGCQE